jgi:hypothetical protein
LLKHRFIRTAKRKEYLTELIEKAASDPAASKENHGPNTAVQTFVSSGLIRAVAPLINSAFLFDSAKFGLPDDNLWDCE